MPETVTFLREGSIGVLRIDNPPVNALSPAVIASLDSGLAAFAQDTALAGLVIECAGRTFVAGGDLAVFDTAGFTPAALNRVLARIEDSDRPVAAALHGTVLGGGVELALACHVRIADPATRLGFPEVTLGLLPGSLGTQRLPRLIGLGPAWRMISTGKPIGATEAQGLGLVDALAADPGAEARAALLRAAGQPPRRSRDRAIPDLDRATALLAEARAEAARKPWQPALAATADLLAAATTEPFAEAEAQETVTFLRLMQTPQSRALRRLFFAERAAQRIPGLPAGTTPREVARVAVLGVGTMGSGIAMAFLDAGYPVTLVETSEAALARGRALIGDAYAAMVRRGRLSDAEARLARITASTDLAALAGADLVIEAVFEDMALKLDLAARLGEVCKPGAVIATNTSTLDVDRIAAASGRPRDVVGTHFFSPAQIMRLLEVVRGRETAPEVLATVLHVARRIGKTAVVSGVCYGFIGNRMAEVYMRESEAMQLEGAGPARIDGVAESPDWIGMAMGPSRMLDMAGVDVGARTVIEWMRGGAGPTDPAYRALCRALFAEGRHGQKTAHGYYRYDGRTALPSPETAALAARLAAEHGIARRDAISEDEIFERLLFPMVNEAARILDEGIAFRGGDIDVVWTAGYGFPAWRGGPLFTADEIGLGRVVARMDHYAAALGNADGRWSVAPLLRRLAEQGGHIADWHEEKGTP